MEENVNIYQQIWDQIGKSKSILMHFHPSPDPDCIGGVLAMREALIKENNNVQVIAGDSPKSETYIEMEGYSEVVEKNIFGVDLEQYDLFLIIDASNKNQISKLVGDIDLNKVKTVVIDHHDSNEGFGDINLIDSSRSSVCEIIYNLLVFRSIEISPSMAVNLYLGIYYDTGGFKYAGTDSKTLLIASKLAEINPEFDRYIFSIDNSQRPDLIRFLGLAFSNIELRCNDKFALACVSYEYLSKNNIHMEYIANNEVANILKSVIGYEISASLIEVQQGNVKVSLRTRDSTKYNVGKIAAQIGGGGHSGAAGVTIKGDIDQAIEVLVNVIRQLYPEIEN